MSDEMKSMKQSKAARVANLAAWRKQRTHEITLPSGLMVLVRDVSMTDLLFTGKLPEAMLDMLQTAAEGNNANVDLKELFKNGEDMRVLVDQLTTLCLLEPLVADKADDSHITLDELSANDKMFIFNWANREVEQVRSFREGEAEPVETV